MDVCPSKLEVFEDLCALRNAILKNNEDVIIRMKKEYEKYIPSELYKCSASLKQDSLSVSILPRDIQSNLVPIKSSGNGDCLYNSFSICLLGNETLSGVLRLLTTVELYQNSEFYANHPRFCERETNYSKTSLFIMSLSVDVSNGNNAMECIRQQAIHTCSPGNWSGLIHIMALSSLLELPVFSVYPESSPAIRYLFHGLIRPRTASTCNSNDLVHIMFTRDSTLDNRNGTVFQPNHFCPLFEVGQSTSEENRLFLDESEFPPLGSESKCKQKNDIRSFFKYPKKVIFKKHLKINDKIASENKNTWLSTKTSISHRNSSSLSNKRVNTKSSSTEQSVQDTVKETPDVTVVQTPEGKFLETLEDTVIEETRKDTIVETSECTVEKTADDDTLKATPDINCLKSVDVESIELSTKCLSRSWYKRKGHELLNECITPVYLSLTAVSRKWYRGVGKGNSVNDESGNVQLELSAISRKWYARRGRLASKNWGRSSTKEKQQVSTTNNMATIRYSNTTGSIDENIENLLKELSATTSDKRTAELKGLVAVGQQIKSSSVTYIQDAGKVYIASCAREHSKKMTSSYLFDFFGRYFNIVQFYLNGKSCIIENRNQKFDCVIQQLQNITSADLDNSCNKKIEGKIGGIFKSAVQMMDTKRDRDILKGLFSHATSVKCVSKMQKVQNKTAIMNCRDELKANITSFQNIKKTSLVVRNDMTNIQQIRLENRIVKKRKDKEMKIRIESRGRMMKCEEWPELAKTLEYIFGEFDQKEKSGGGVEAHPRLKNNNMYRSNDNNTFMRQALEIVNSISPPSFNISLSSCFNYTMTYKRNTASAKRHHHGKNVNANISLHHPPKTLVKNLVVNLHYSTANVNYICENGDKQKSDVCVDSKDAKKIVCAEICPVQKPGRTWSEMEYPDHDWDQSRTNAVTPMTHLFMNTKITKRESILPNPALQNLELNFDHTDTVLHVTRTGKAVTLVNPSLLEPDTTIKLINEIFLLLTKPSLDYIFRNSTTGLLKSIFIFIVDNGPAEQPASTLVQMLLIRLLRTLNLDKITQVSFAEYHSKRNFVERVHSIEDEVLSRHGPFTAHKIFNEKNIQPGSSEHIVNMDEMAKDVATCLSQAKFGGTTLEAYRGIKPSEHVFRDEEKVKQFLLLSEEQKMECSWIYKAEDTTVWNELDAIWNLSQQKEYTYVDDYKLLMNTLYKERTTWMDKYQITFYRPNEQWKGDILTRKELQPIPDYIRWISTGGELHYLSFEKSVALKGDWDNSPGLFRPERLLDILISLNSDPPDYIFSTIASFVWLTENDVRQYFSEQNEKFRFQYHEDLEREKWKGHELFAKNVDSLKAMCKKNGLSVKGQKHHLVERIVTANNEGSSVDYKHVMKYEGNFQSIPSSVCNLRKLSTAQLRFILNYHGLPTHGTKEELCLRLFLLRQKRYYLAFKSQEDELKRMLSVVSSILFEQRRNAILNPTNVHRRRTHYTYKGEKSFLAVPNHLTLENVHTEMLKPIREYLKILNEMRITKNDELNRSRQSSLIDLVRKGIHNEEFMVVGKRVKIKWSKDEIGDSGWKCGWYTAMVQGFSLEHDSINIVYFSEKECVYTVCVSELIAKGKLVSA